jgi:hypothetical protein
MPVKFLKDEDGDVFAYFPSQIIDNDNDRLCFGNIHACTPQYANDCKIANENESFRLFEELENLGYQLQVI